MFPILIWQLCQQIGIEGYSLLVRFGDRKHGDHGDYPLVEYMYQMGMETQVRFEKIFQLIAPASKVELSPNLSC